MICIVASAEMHGKIVRVTPCLYRKVYTPFIYKRDSQKKIIYKKYPSYFKLENKSLTVSAITWN
jgi:hypothetical protein